MSVPELYGKNGLGDVAKVYNLEKYLGIFSSQILPNLASTYLESVRESFDRAKDQNTINFIHAAGVDAEMDSESKLPVEAKLPKSGPG